MKVRLPFVFARRFVAAETFEGALPIIRNMREKGLSTTIDILGEYVDNRDVATAARDAYIGLVQRVADENTTGLGANVSIKLSMMGQKIDLDFCLANLRQLLTVARQRDVFIRLDMEGTDMTQTTLDLFEEVYPEFPDHVGPVLQAYLKRTQADIDRMCALKARVRLCKGAYKEPESLAWQKMPEIRERYIAYMQQLITDSRYPGIATHDTTLHEATKAFVASKGLGKDRFEFQMLYGMRSESQLALAREGYSMRVYVPYGTEWIPYYSRRLRERKENVWFVLSNLLRK